MGGASCVRALRRLRLRLRTGGWRGGVGLVALLALAVACACAVRAPVSLSARVLFPRAHPADLAHLLADFSTHPHQGSWRVEEERSNYTEWRYKVSFSCGVRCYGSAWVHATAGSGAGSGGQQAGEPRHGRLAKHSVRMDRVACSQLPLLSWPVICEEMEITWVVSEGAGGTVEGAGSVVEEKARAWCGAWRVLTGACGRDLRAHLAAALLRSA